MGESGTLLGSAFLNPVPGSKEADYHYPDENGYLYHHCGEGYILDRLRLERWGRFWWKSVYSFRLIPEHPLAFRDREGNLWQVDRHEAETDLGSIPPPVSGFFPAAEWQLSYIYHDSACRHNGLWFKAKGSLGPFEFKALTRSEIDQMLRDEWIPAEARLVGGAPVRRWPVWAGVRIGALFGAGVYPQESK